MTFLIESTATNCSNRPNIVFQKLCYLEAVSSNFQNPKSYWWSAWALAKGSGQNNIVEALQYHLKMGNQKDSVALCAMAFWNS